MPKDKLTSNVLMSLFAVLAVSAISVTGCGGSGSSNPDGGDAGDAGGAAGGGGKGGAGGAAGMGGKGGGGTAGGGTAGGAAGSTASGGTAGGGTAGGGTAGGGTSGGGKGGGGTAGGGTAGGGTAGGGTAGGTAGMGGIGGAVQLCVVPPVCTLNSNQCVASGPQKCLADNKGCPNWVPQTACGAHQACNAATGGCDCVNDAKCMGMEGSFCPTAGGGTFSQCTKDANGCYTVTAAGTACTAPQICSVPGVVMTGTACGCPADGTTLGTGCSTHTVGDAAASPADNAVLQCQAVGACKIWKILVNCADQSLTAGTVGGLPLCVCKAAGSAPGDAHTLYVDPSPPQALGMNGPTTGALQPPACRFRAIGDALVAASTTGSPFTRVVAIHESTATATFSNEPVPLALPGGVTVTTADGPSFNTDHYVIALSGNQTLTRITLGNGASLSGFKIDGTQATGSQILITNTPASSIDLHYLNIVSPGGTGTIGIQISGAVAATAGNLVLSGADTAIDLVNTSGTAGSVAKLTATAITSTSSLFGVHIGTNSSLVLGASTIGVANGTGIFDAGSASLTGVAVTVSGIAGTRTGIALSGAASVLTTSGGSVTVVDSGGIGVDADIGTATLATTPVTVSVTPTVAGTSTGVNLGLTGALTLTGTTVTTGDSGTGIALGGGAASITGGGVTTGATSTGVNVAGSTLSIAGATIKVGATSTGLVATGAAKVTTAGTATANTVLTTSVTGGSIDGDGLVLDDPTATLAINGNTVINGFRTGLVVTDGSVDVAGGNVIVSGNTADGADFLNATPSLTAHAILTSATFQNNKGNGVSVSSQVFTKFVTSTFSTNTLDGVLVQSIPPSAAAQSLFDIESSTISGNSGRGIAITGVGPVAANIQANTISGNKLSGVLVSSAMDATVGVALQDNDISGNLTTAANASIIGGGVFFSKVAAVGTPQVGPSNITLTKFVGNKVHSNVRNQIAFDFIQSGATAWNLSSNPTAVDMAILCADAAKPNSVYCYNSGATLGLGVAVGDPTIPVTIKGMHFAEASPTAGTDYSNQPLVSVSLSCPAITTCP